MCVYLELVFFKCCNVTCTENVPIDYTLLHGFFLVSSIKILFDVGAIAKSAVSIFFFFFFFQFSCFPFSCSRFNYQRFLKSDGLFFIFFGTILIEIVYLSRNVFQRLKFEVERHHHRCENQTKKTKKKQKQNPVFDNNTIGIPIGFVYFFPPSTGWLK